MRPNRHAGASPAPAESTVRLCRWAARRAVPGQRSGAPVPLRLGAQAGQHGRARLRQPHRLRHRRLQPLAQQRPRPVQPAFRHAGIMAQGEMPKASVSPNSTASVSTATRISW